MLAFAAQGFTGLLLAGLGLLAQAQTSGATVPSLPPQYFDGDKCRSDVSKFEQVIGLIRSAQGNAAAAALKEKLLPAAIEADILAKGGYCGLAAHLRQKKLI